MRRMFSIIALVVLASAGFALAATYTITTTAAQEVKLSRLRVVLNTSGGQNYADNNAMVLDLCGTNLTNGIRDVDDQDAIAMAARVRTATQAQRDSACTALGGTVSNGRCQ